MKNLIIFSHPNQNSFNSSILEKVKDVLEDRKEEVDLVDLYKDKFNPVLFFDEENPRRNMVTSEETKIYRDKLLWADNVIFIYPVWWTGIPAILKGFFDKVFASGFAFKYKGTLPEGLLKNKTSKVIYTMDAPSFFDKFLIRKSHYKILKKQILEFCGFRNIKQTAFYSVRKTSSEKLSKSLNKLEKFI